MKPIRLIVVALSSVLAFFGLSHTAQAAPFSCFVSSGTLQQGQSFTISGSDSAAAGESIHAILDGTTLIGTGFSSGTPLQFSFTATIPTTASAPASHSLTLTSPDGDFSGCPTLFVTAAAPTASPTPVTTPTPTTTAAPVAVATFPPFVVLQQQQQQQQQAGGGGGGSAPQRQGSPARAAGGGQQQQQQQQSGGGILPRTGVDIGKTAAWGAGLLAFGLLLVMFARRRRRIARSRALELLPPIDAVIVESDEPWTRGTAHPSEFLTEADGLPPVYLPEVEQLYLPAPEAEADDDVLTPSF